MLAVIPNVHLGLEVCHRGYFGLYSADSNLSEFIGAGETAQNVQLQDAFATIEQLKVSVPLSCSGESMRMDVIVANGI